MRLTDKCRLALIISPTLYKEVLKMLYIVGTVQQAEKTRGIFSPVIFQRVFELAEILDENYGKDRNIFGDDGGYICIVENESDIKELKLSYGVDIGMLTEEYSNPITDDYIEVLFLFNNEFGMTLIAPIELEPIKRFSNERPFKQIL